MLNFLSEYVYKRQLYLRPFYNILKQQNNFEWTTEHQTRIEEIKKFLIEQISNTIPDPNQPFAMCDASNFGIGAALLQSHNGTKKMNLISETYTICNVRCSKFWHRCSIITMNLIPYAVCDASNFGIGAALLQSHNGTKKMNLISANSRLFTQAELRLFTLMRECTAIIHTLTEYEFLILGSKHPTVLFTDHKPIIFLFRQK